MAETLRKTFFAADSDIRRASSQAPAKTVIFAIIFAAIGASMGLLSKVLDTTAFNELPYFMQAIDLTNLLGRLGIWLIIALAISVLSKSPVRAAVYVFTFFLGMVTVYYAYSDIVAGFMPRSYAMIWIGLTTVSPLLAYVCWFAKGKGPASIVLTSCIIAAMIYVTLAFGQYYVDPISIPELIMLILAIVLMRRKPLEMLIACGAAVPLAVILKVLMPIALY